MLLELLQLLLPVQLLRLLDLLLLLLRLHGRRLELLALAPATFLCSCRRRRGLWLGRFKQMLPQPFGSSRS